MSAVFRRTYSLFELVGTQGRTSWSIGRTLQSPYLLPSSRHISHTASLSNKPKAVVFDLGGVVIPSPLPLIANFEIRHCLPNDSVNATIRHYGKEGAFAHLERGELTLEGFCAPFAEEFSNLHGITVTEDQIWELATVLGGIDDSMKGPYQEVLNLILRLRDQGIKTAILTNNFRFDNGKTALPKGELGVDLVSNNVQCMSILLYFTFQIPSLIYSWCVEIVS